MRGPGILWMLQTAAGFSMAGPMFVVGIDFLRTGRPAYGVAFLAFGAVALYLPTYLVNRLGGWFRGLFSLGRRTGGSEPNASGDGGSGSEPDSSSTPDSEATGSSTLWDRFRRR